MTYLKHIFYISIVGLLLASCSNYSLISDNDVYLQKPAAIDLTDDEQDITSFNAYKAGRQGRYQNGDQRLRNTNARAFSTYNTSFMFGTYFNPFHQFYPTDPFLWGRPYGYGYGLNSSLYGMNTYYAPGFGYGHWNNYYGYGYGNNYYGYGSNMYPYYGHNNYGINYIGPNSYYNGSCIASSGGSSFGSGSSNQFYGPRTALSGNSSRSSSYPQTLKNKMHNNTKPTGTSVYSKNLSSQNIKHRRKVSNSQREYVKTNVNANRNISRTTTYKESNRNVNASTTNGRRTTASSTNNYRNSSYTPSNTARRSGTVSRSNTNQRTGSYNSSNSTRRSTYNSSSRSRGSTYNSGSSRGSSYSSPQRSSGSSYKSSGSSSRSSGSSSSRGGSSSSGRR